MAEQEINSNSEIQSEREDRLKKLTELREKNIPPYPSASNRTHKISSILKNFENFTENKEKLTINGRLMSKRAHGNLIFAVLRDESGEIQIAFSKKDIGEESFKNFKKLIDRGDFAEIAGTCFVTQKGEKSLMVDDWKLLSKALRPLPEKWHGIKSEEERLRKRYLDILMNPKVKDMVIKRAEFWRSVRNFMVSKGFLEVETPILETTAGGADAQPFITRHNALDIDVYLRISMGELWQKKLMVAGLEKTFEIGRQFRNEGMDAEHLQDYTQMEFYWAYADYEDGMKLAEELFKYVAKETFGTLQFNIHGFEVDLDKKWKRYDYQETVKEFTGVDILNTTEQEIKNKLHQLEIKYDEKGFNLNRGIDSLWKYCRKQLAGPGFLVGVPKIISPLAKTDENRPELTQRFQPIIAGSELGNGYSELNDPVDQAERFALQEKMRAAGDEEAQMFDHDFVEALEYGMPPTCGFGMSERVFAFFMDKSARESQIFPLMRPKNLNVSVSEEQKINENKDIKKDKEDGLGIDRKKAEQLINKYISNENTRLHSLETEAIMRKVAEHLGKDEEKWGIIGLLHDLDWDMTADNTREHTMKTAEILKQEGGSEFLIESVQSHCFGNTECGAWQDKKRQTKLQHCLAAAETLTGLIAAAALVQPDKSVNSLKLKSLKKKFKTSGFAANCDREIIKECEQAGIDIDSFLQLGLEALQEKSEELGI
ncbi:MAG: lysine--tRNA ligase [Patescibacteria group bacterium]